MEKGSMTDTIRIVWPLVLAMASNAIMQFTDRVFLARWDDVAIQASLPAGILSFVMISVFQGTVAYSGTFVAQFYGARARMACARAFAQGCWLTLATIPFFLLLTPVGYGLLSLAGHSPDVFAQEKIYFTILTLGGVIPCAAAVLSGFFSGRGMTRLVMVAHIIGNFLNIVLDYVMIFGVAGCPAMGIAGAAWATVISQTVPLVILAIAAAFDPTLRGLQRLRVAFAFNRDLCVRIIRFGLPSGVHVFLDVASFTIFIMLTGRLDAMSFAASNIGFTINHLAFAPLMGIGMGASVLVGQYQGEGNSVAAARAGRSALLLAWGYMILISLFILLSSASLMRLFRGDASAFDPDAFVRLGRILMCILVSWGMFDAVNLVLGGALKGAGDTRFVMVLNISLGLFLWLPAVVFLINYYPSIIVLWLTLPVYCAILATGFILRWRGGAWRSITMVQPTDRAL